MSEPSGENINPDSLSVVRGSSVVFAGALCARGCRFLLVWLLAGLLGTEVYGTYVFAITLASVVAALAPMGSDSGLLYFGARFRESSNLSALKGVLRTGLTTATIGGCVSAAGLALVAPWVVNAEADAVGVVRIAAVSVALSAPLLACVGAIRSTRDMKQSTLALMVVLPIALVVLVGGAAILGLGIQGAMMGYAIAHGLALATAVRGMWRHFGRLLLDTEQDSETGWGSFLRYSLPQSLAASVFRLNLWMDLLMLGWLAQMRDVGHYRLAVALAILVQLPVMAMVTSFNPLAAELLEANQRERLQRTLQTLTRWVLGLSGALLLLLLGLGGWGLEWLDPTYGEIVIPMRILLFGQLVVIACSLTVRLIPMSGRAMHNLGYGLLALALNIALNWMFIPRWGLLGAAWASTIALAFWSISRLIYVRVRLGCQPFDRRGAITFAVVTVSGLLLWAGAPGGFAVPLAVLVLALALSGRGEEDQQIRRTLKRRLRLPS